jgi:hypothetical protein
MPLAVTNGTPIPRATRKRTFDAQLRTAAGEISVEIDFVAQHPYRNLCWAACGEMVFRHYGLNASMCENASLATGRRCCAGGPVVQCDVTAWPHDLYDRARYLSHRRSFRWRRAGRRLELQEIAAELRENRPVQIYLQWRRGSSHTALIAGARTDGGLYVVDPQFRRGWLAFDYVARAYNLGAWTDTWYALEPVNGPIA